MEDADSTGSSHMTALAMQLLNMVQREFDKQYRELKKALKEENEENDMRVRLFAPHLLTRSATPNHALRNDCHPVSGPLGRLPGRGGLEGHGDRGTEEEAS